MRTSTRLLGTRAVEPLKSRGARFRKFGLPAALVLLLTAGTPSQVVHAFPGVPITDLGTLGGSYSQAYALNDDGHVVGYSYIAGNTTQHAFSWTQAGGLVDLGLPPGGTASFATAVNASGQVAGYFSGAGIAHTFFWSQSVGLIDLGTLGGAYSYPAALSPNAMNDNGQVVGYSTTASGTQHAFSWTQSGGMIDLGVPSFGSYSAATAVNYFGQVVGNSGNHGFSWTQTGGFVDIGSLGGWSDPNAVSSNGQVVGVSATASGVQHAFSWTAAGGMVDLGTLGGSYSQAYALNQSGQIVGISTSATGDTHAFSWTSVGGMIDLGTLGGTASDAVALSDFGQVAGHSTTSSGVTHAFSWTSVGGMIDLGTLGGNASDAAAINLKGQVAGDSMTTTGLTHSALFTASPIPPTITGISPTSGTTAGGTEVTITGSGFLTNAHGNVTLDQVYLCGSTVQTWSVQSDTTLVAWTEPHSAGCGFPYGAILLLFTDPTGWAYGYYPSTTFTYGNASPTAAVSSPSYSGSEGSPIAISGTAGDSDGDTVTTTWTVAPNAGDDLGAGCTMAAPNSLSTSLTCNDEGTYTVTLTATDSAGNTATANSTVTVSNATPTVGAISGLPVAPIAMNTTVTASATFTDHGTLDSHRAVWTWGDGTTSGATATETVGSGTGSVSGTHTYTASGVYTVSLTISDADGSSGTNSFQFVVVYDPSAGFLTGGGWINSPSGAYAADAGATGKASFGFVSKYQRGATVPSGNTQFQFEAGNLDFHSTAYQWMVITGNCRGQFKGTGSINGVGSYTFILTAIDGEQCSNPGPDTFRIQITDNNNNGVLVYDNGYDQAIGAGDITLHS